MKRSQESVSGSALSGEWVALELGEAPALQVGPGCVRRDLPGMAGVRVWVVDMEPGATWPRVDEHETGEAYLVVSGEVVEGDQRFGVGTYVRFAAGSRHRPHTESGVRLLGFNPTSSA